MWALLRLRISSVGKQLCAKYGGVEDETIGANNR
jgi:hypothetical protein